MSPLRIKQLANFLLRPILAQQLPRIFFFFLKGWNFFFKICAHSGRYRNLMAGIFEVQTFIGDIAFPLPSVLLCLFL